MVDIRLRRKRTPSLVLLLVLIPAIAAVFALGSPAPGRAAEPARGCRVFLTFDIELEEDIEALRLLEPPAPCTLFITGEFAESFPDTVREWSKRHEIACHTMSHPHMTSLGAKAQEQEIRESAEILERLSGAKCLGFRAPYLEANDLTRQALIRLGFRYQSSIWDSDEQSTSGAELLEFPISDQAGDYNLFELDKVSDADALKLLLAVYAERSLSGRPMVVLLHPHDIGKHAGVLRQFIEHVGRARQQWGCFRDWLGEAGLRQPGRRALWVDTKAIAYNAEDVIASAQLVGFTDLFVQAYDAVKGPLYGPGNPHDDYFNGIIDDAHARGMKVHAWFPICFDPIRVRQNPEWGAVDARGVRSKDFVCPTNAPWRRLLLEMFKELLENYSVDGIHFDELRFQGADFCQCSVCRAALARRAEIDWPAGMSTEGNPDARGVWCDYRAELIRDLTATIAAAARAVDSQIVLSAAVRPEGALNSDGVERFGQSYEMLGPLLDFIVPMAYHRREHQPIGWVKAVQLSGQWRAGSTPVWIGIQAFEDPGRPPTSLSEFGSLLEAVRHGGDGVALCSYAPLFSLAIEGDSGRNMPSGAADFVRRWSMGHRVGSEESGAVAQARATTQGADQPDHPDPAARRRGDHSPVAWLLSGLGLAAVLLLVVLRLRKRRRAATVPELPLSVLESLACERALRGDQTVFITQRLGRLQAVELDRIRSDSLLLRIHEAGGELPLEAAAEPAGPLSLQCAIGAGLIRDGGDCWQLTHAGLDRLRAVLADETDRAWGRLQSGCT
jgi:peptidoglycan/xylan/chitin deacetylase (PgdA/CDA1 family)